MNAVPQIEIPQDGARRILAKFLSRGYIADGLHCYADADGVPVFYRARCKHPDGRKEIRPMHLDGLRFVVGEPPAPKGGKLLYRLPDLLAADPGSPVMIVEGEKCADALHRLGMVAATSGNATSAHGADWTPMRGRRAVLWPDHDVPGMGYARDVAAKLCALGCVVEVLDVAALSLPTHGDCVDWLAANPGVTAADVLTLLRGDLPQRAEPDHDADELQPLLSPTVSEAMFYGLTGEIMRAATEGKETHPAPVGAAFLSMAAVAFGREVTVTVGDARHAPRLFTCHVGRSSAAGKGMALELMKRIRRRADEIYGPLSKATGNMHDGGLSSREGLAWMIRDESDTKDKDGVPTDPGVDDKRLLVIEEEFANVLHQAQRDGNTLSAALRTAWDGGDLAPATKNNRTRASRPHIGMHASITPFELSELMSECALSNGFANRFLFVWGERRGIVPFPPRTPDTTVDALARGLLDCIARVKKAATMGVTDTARDLFAAFYRQHRRGAGLSSEVRGLIQRHPPYAWRLATTFALLDGVQAIEAPHMRAALAWLDYFRESTVLVFGTAKSEADAACASALGERILRALDEAGGAMDREPLRLVLGKPTKADFDKAISHLAETGQAVEAATRREGGGRPRRTITLVAPEPPQRFARIARFGSTQGSEQSADAARFGQFARDHDHALEQTAPTAGASRFAGASATAQTAHTAEAAGGSLSASGEMEECVL